MCISHWAVVSCYNNLRGLRQRNRGGSCAMVSGQACGEAVTVSDPAGWAGFLFPLTGYRSGRSGVVQPETPSERETCPQEGRGHTAAPCFVNISARTALSEHLRELVTRQPVRGGGNLHMQIRQDHAKRSHSMLHLHFRSPCTGGGGTETTS